MKSIYVILAAAACVKASPYLEYCKLFGYESKQNEGFSIKATCGIDDTPECFELNVSHCVANAYGELWPAMQSQGLFNNTCNDCTIGLDKTDNEQYGMLQCDCSNGTEPPTNTHSSIDTDTIVVYESKLGMICPYGADSATRSVSCVKPNNVTAIPPPKRERPIRREIRMLRPWRID